MTTIEELEERARVLARTIQTTLPKGVGFTLLLFNFDPHRDTTYISNADRETMIHAMQEFIDKVGKQDDEQTTEAKPGRN